MSKGLFEEFNKQANYNLGVKGNLSNVVIAYTNLAKSMGKEDVAIEMIASLPPAEALNNKDFRIDEICNVYYGEDYSQEQVRTR